MNTQLKQQRRLVRQAQATWQLIRSELFRLHRFYWAADRGARLNRVGKAERRAYERYARRAETAGYWAH